MLIPRDDAAFSVLVRMLVVEGYTSYQSYQVSFISLGIKKQKLRSDFYESEYLIIKICKSQSFINIYRTTLAWAFVDLGSRLASASAKVLFVSKLPNLEKIYLRFLYVFDVFKLPIILSNFL